MSVCKNGPSACTSATSGARSTRREYFPSGEVSKVTRHNGVVEERFHFDDGEMSRMRRQRPSDAAGTFSKDQEYTYDVDANRTKDERGTHVYNARDQLVQWTRAGDRRYGGSSVSYTVDGAGRVELVQDSSPLPDRDPEYQGERVDFERVEGITIDHAYDVFGSVKSISGGGFTQTFEYDGRERIIKKTTNNLGTEEGGSYVYDALDRRDRKVSGPPRHR